MIVFMYQQVGMNVVGVVSNIVEYGVFVQLSQKLSGLVPQKVSIN